MERKDAHKKTEAIPRSAQSCPHPSTSPWVKAEGSTTSELEPSTGVGEHPVPVSLNSGVSHPCYLAKA